MPYTSKSKELSERARTVHVPWRPDVHSIVDALRNSIAHSEVTDMIDPQSRVQSCAEFRPAGVWCLALNVPGKTNVLHPSTDVYVHNMIWLLPPSYYSYIQTNPQGDEYMTSPCTTVLKTAFTGQAAGISVQTKEAVRVAGQRAFLCTGQVLQVVMCSICKAL